MEPWSAEVDSTVYYTFPLFAEVLYTVLLLYVYQYTLVCRSRPYHTVLYLGRQRYAGLYHAVLYIGQQRYTVLFSVTVYLGLQRYTYCTVPWSAEVAVKVELLFY